MSREPHDLRLARELRDGEPCSHPGCAHHITHPCEGCGRIGARSPAGGEAVSMTDHWGTDDAIVWSGEDATTDGLTIQRIAALATELDRKGAKIVARLRCSPDLLADLRRAAEPYLVATCSSLVDRIAGIEIEPDPMFPPGYALGLNARGHVVGYFWRGRWHDLAETLAMYPTPA